MNILVCILFFVVLLFECYLFNYAASPSSIRSRHAVLNGTMNTETGIVERRALGLM